MNIRIFDKDLAFIREIQSFESASITRRYDNYNTLKLNLSFSDMQNEIIKGNYLLFNNDKKKFFRIKDLSFNIENADVEVLCYGSVYFLDQRITVPDFGESHLIASGYIDECINFYIDKCLINADDVDRNINFLKVEDVELGSVISDSSRYSNLLDEAKRLLALDELGIESILDPYNKEILIRVVEGVDRSSSNGVVNPVIFSLEYENIIDGDYFESDISKTFCYVGGQGEAEQRVIAHSKIGSYINENRTEVFKDARDISDLAELIDRGNEELVLPTEYLEVEIDPFGNLVYQEDFNLGDIVTVEIFGRRVDARINEIVEIYENEILSLECTLGYRALTLIDEIKKNSKNIDSLKSI